MQEGQGPLEILQLDFEMENFTSQSVKRRIMWHIDYRGHGALLTWSGPDRADGHPAGMQAILPLAMVSCPRRRQAKFCAWCWSGTVAAEGRGGERCHHGGFLEEVSIQWRLEGLMEEELTRRR